MDWQSCRFQQADGKRGCVPLGSQRTQAKLSGILSRAKIMVLWTALMIGKMTRCREVWTLALIKSGMLMEVKWMLACALVEKESTSCEIILIKWMLNAKHKMPKFNQPNVAGFPSLFCLVNCASANRKSGSRLLTWSNMDSVSNIKPWNLRFGAGLFDGNKEARVGAIDPILCFP